MDELKINTLMSFGPDKVFLYMVKRFFLFVDIPVNCINDTVINSDLCLKTILFCFPYPNFS